MTFRVMIGILFIYSGVIKVSYPGEFAFAVQNYQLIPDAWTNLVAIVLPWMEIYSGLFLLIGIYPRASALVISLLMLVFILALILAIIRGLDINCGCYGKETPVDWQKIGEDILILLLSTHLIIYPSKKLSLDKLFKRLA